jgi:hypothetical protein
VQSDLTDVQCAGHRYRAKLALGIVGLLISIAGAVLIFIAWSSQQQPETGICRAAIFVVVMAAVSAAGYLLYVNQATPKEAAPCVGWRVYLPALRMAIIQQLIFLVLGALMLDMRQARHVCMVATVAHWATILIVIYRRPRVPTKADLMVIRWGYVPIMLVVATIGPLIWARLERW